MSCQRCFGPDHGAQLCPICEAEYEHEQNLEERHAGQAVCFLAQFSWTPCEGRMDPAHLIAKSVMKREHVPTDVLWDPRVWVPACRKHHGALDTARTLRVPRERLPEGLEAFAEKHGLGWWLTRTYGTRSDESEAA